MRDTRTVHIVHETTVKALEDAIRQEQQQNSNDKDSPTADGISSQVLLNPTRFRPNIVLRGGDDDDVKPFSEFDWIGQSLQLGGSSVRLRVIAKTVRCDGVSIDPLLGPNSKLDIPALLMKHFPGAGPYLGVYAVIEQGGWLGLNDQVSLVSDDGNDKV